jgi:hypothetical protein
LDLSAVNLEEHLAPLRDEKVIDDWYHALGGHFVLQRVG